MALALVTAAVIGWQVRQRDRQVPLFHSTLALGAGGRVVELPVGDESRLIKGTRVLADTPDATTLADEQRAWLADGAVPILPEVDDDLARDALLDLHVLSTGHDAPVAGWSPPWNHVWPRDSAFAAAALARTGHRADAERILSFLTRAQRSDGLFEARYRTDGSGPPDDRELQLDGVGWALWTLDQVAATVPTDERAAWIAEHEALLRRSADAVTRLTDTDGSLPPVSPDYWEVPETRLTLATAAVLLAGADAAVSLYDRSGDARSAAEARRVADRLRTAIHDGFGPDYPRHLGGSAASVDLGVAFLLPPFGSENRPEPLSAWRHAENRMARPAGGLAPGGGWRRNGISWTPTTATYAMVAAANGDRETAIRYLRWVDQHRTPAGSIPEKVLANGAPASVAPLGWPTAAVIWTMTELGEA